MTSVQVTTTGSYRRTEDVLSRNVGDDVLILVRPSRDLISLHGSARALWDVLRTPHSPARAAARLAEIYDAAEDVVRDDIAPVLAELTERGALQRTDETP